MKKEGFILLSICAISVGCIPPKIIGPGNSFYSSAPAGWNGSQDPLYKPTEKPTATPAESPGIRENEVLTFAGSGEPGYLDGPSKGAKFNCPEGIAIDEQGNLFFVDSRNNRIGKIDLEGKVTTLAGSGEAGYLDGIASAASFNQPNDLAFDASGNLVIADQKNNAIRVVGPDGAVRTLAGSGEPGYSEGQGKAAKFDTPQGIAVDQAGNVYVADTWNQRIRKIRPDGLVTTLAGSGESGFKDGAGGAAKFNHPQGLATDKAGNVYVADSWNQRIRKISPDASVSTLAGTGEAGFLDGREARFNGPVGLAISKEGIVYVGDTWNHRVRKVTPDGLVSTLAGNGSYGFKDGKAEEACFKSADKIAIDARGDLYVSDPLNQRIRKVSK